VQSGKFEGGKLMLFFGARTQEELPYFGPLQNLPKDFIDVNFAFSRMNRPGGAPKRYVQDLMRERAADLAPLLADPNAYFYVCGLKAMEDGVVLALHDVTQRPGLSWDTDRPGTAETKAACTWRPIDGRFSSCASPPAPRRGAGHDGPTRRSSTPSTRP
jgi:hypothetical protein